MSKFKLLIASAACMALIACGGGGSTTTPPGGTTSKVKGTVAVGAALVGATVTAKDKDGKTVTAPSVTDASGNYADLDLSTLTAPIMLEAKKDGSDSLYSYLPEKDKEVANITEITQAMANQALGKSPKDVFADPSTLSAGAPTKADLDAAMAQITKLLNDYFAKAGANQNDPTVKDPLNTPFVVGQSDIDKLMDLIKVALGDKNPTISSADGSQSKQLPPIGQIPQPMPLPKLKTTQYDIFTSTTKTNTTSIANTDGTTSSVNGFNLKQTAMFGLEAADAGKKVSGPPGGFAFLACDGNTPAFAAVATSYPGDTSGSKLNLGVKVTNAKALSGVMFTVLSSCDTAPPSGPPEGYMVGEDGALTTLPIMSTPTEVLDADTFASALSDFNTSVAPGSLSGHRLAAYSFELGDGKTGFLIVDISSTGVRLWIGSQDPSGGPGGAGGTPSFAITVNLTDASGTPVSAAAAQGVALCVGSDADFYNIFVGDNLPADPFTASGVPKYICDRPDAISASLNLIPLSSASDDTYLYAFAIDVSNGKIIAFNDTALTLSQDGSVDQPSVNVIKPAATATPARARR